jgi:predicted nucleic acid-binding protein
MRVLLDTSVLVAAVVQAHPMHGRALPWLVRGRRGEFQLVVASHTLAEMYAVLTTLPVKPRISPNTAWQLICENVVRRARVVALAAADYRATIKQLAGGGLAGGVVYDALIARAAQKAGVDRLLTLDADDFERVWPDGSGKIAAP